MALTLRNLAGYRGMERWRCVSILGKSLLPYSPTGRFPSPVASRACLCAVAQGQTPAKQSERPRAKTGPGRGSAEQAGGAVGYVGIIFLARLKTDIGQLGEPTFSMFSSQNRNVHQEANLLAFLLRKESQSHTQNQFHHPSPASPIYAVH